MWRDGRYDPSLVSSISLVWTMNRGGNARYGTIENSCSSSLSLTSTLLMFSPQTTNVFRIIKSFVTLVFLVTVLCVGIVLVTKTESKVVMEDLQSVIVVARHGERQPLVPIQGMGNFTPADLTDHGKEQMKVLGHNLAQHYRLLLERIANAQVVAANQSRFIESATAMMTPLNVPFTIRLIPELVIDARDANSYKTFLDKELLFRQQVPNCTKQAALTIMSSLGVNLPEEHQLLYGVLIADSLDMARERGVKLPFDLDNLKCVQEKKKFLGPDLYQAVADLTTETFGKGDLRDIVMTMQNIRKNRKASFDAFCLSDAHVTGLLKLASPKNQLPARPGYGASVVFHFFPNDLEVLYSPSYNEPATVWTKRENIDEFLARMEKALK